MKSLKTLAAFALGALTCIVVVCLALPSCGGDAKKQQKKLSAESIESKFASGVVLIQTQYFYTMDIDGVKTIYFTGVDENGQIENLTFDPSEARMATKYGTGFLVGKDGLIATNSHVAVPSVDSKQIRSQIVEAFNNMTREGANDINQMNDQIARLQTELINADTPTEKSQINSRLRRLIGERDQAQELISYLNTIGTRDYEVNMKSEIGIAYNSTHITGTKDFISCVVVANDPEHDLSLIQLKDKQTPEKKHIFKLPKERKRKTDSDDQEGGKAKGGAKIGKKVFLIGFNLGPEFAITDAGIKAQVTSGEISQDRGSVILYTIPTLNGSSGSPVIDEYGKLVAVNFAGIGATQSFNEGVKVKFLAKLIKEYQDEADED